MADGLGPSDTEAAFVANVAGVSLAFPGGMVDASSFATIDSNKSTRVPERVAAALSELEAATREVDRTLFFGGDVATRLAASDRLRRAVAQVQFETSQHCTEARAR